MQVILEHYVQKLRLVPQNGWDMSLLIQAAQGLSPGSIIKVRLSLLHISDLDWTTLLQAHQVSIVKVPPSGIG